MRVTVPVAVAVPLAATLLVACGSTAEAPIPTATPDAYVAEVEAALRPPGRLASLVTTGARSGTYTASRRDLDEVVGEAERHLATLRAMDLPTAALRRQRDAFAGAYAAVAYHMVRVADAVAAGDRDEVLRVSRPFFASLRGLSSAVSPSS